MNRVQAQFIALLAAATVVAPALAQTGDHVACYKVKDRAKHGVFTLTVTNAGVTQSCSVTVPARLGCLSTQISAVAPTPPGDGPSPGAAGDVLCYPLLCPRPFPSAAQMTDGFGGQRVVNFKRAQLLCAPATRGLAAIVPSTTTTTIAPGPCDFDTNQRKCRGTCGDGGHCSAVASGGACECRTTPCGDADSPSCDGFCAPDEACIFTVTGCSCLSIP
jgi:hypothetical protein